MTMTNDEMDNTIPNEGIKSEKVILAMEALLTSNSIYIPFLGSHVKKNLLEDYLADLKQTLKEDFNDLNDIHALKEQIILDAQQEADIIRQKARNEVEEQDIVETSHEYAKQILQRAKEEADAILTDASELRNDLIINTHKYCDSLIDSLSNDLNIFQNSIHDTRNELRITLDTKISKLDNNQPTSV